MCGPALWKNSQAGLEPRYSAADRLLRRLEGSARRGLRQRLQGAVGALPEARRRRRLVPLGAARSRQRRAARRARPEELAAEEVARRSEAETMKRDTVLTIKLPDGEFAVREP